MEDCQTPQCGNVDCTQEQRTPKPSPTIADMFEKLGSSKVADPRGLAFGFAQEDLHLKADKALFDKSGKLVMTKLPRPDYEHRIYRDKRTGHYLVVRPGTTGLFYKYGNDMERLR